MKPAKTHPNTTVAAGGTTLAVIVVWVIGNIAHQHISAEAGAVIAGAVSSVALFIGREGVRGIWRRLIDGTGKT